MAVQVSQPRVCAEFKMAGGKPDFITVDGAKHYRIRLFVEGAPEDAYAVTYKLHESYYDPVREVHQDSEQFEEEITSYGDFAVAAKIRGRQRSESSQVILSRALQESYKNTSDPTIQQAINDIKQN